MNYSVGILYSAGDFLQKLHSKPINMSEFKRTTEKYSLVNTESILDISQKCNWIEVDEFGVCRVSNKGLILLNESEPQLRLRSQLKDVIEFYQPSWVHRMKSGRTEVKNYLAADINQIFEEAGMYSAWDDELIQWWDILSQTAYSIEAAQKMNIGRMAEFNTVQYEYFRTSNEPTWVSLESNNMGFDVLSRISSKNKNAKRIEVKGTKQSLKEAHFYLSRNEYEIGKTTDDYYFYLWVLRKPLYVIPVPFKDVQSHTPLDQERGEWKNVKIPYKPFKRLKIEIKDEVYKAA